MKGGVSSPGWFRRGIPLPLLSSQQVFPREEIDVVAWASVTYGMLLKQPVTGLKTKLGGLPMSHFTFDQHKNGSNNVGWHCVVYVTDGYVSKVQH